jgi:hypothetical protein
VEVRERTAEEGEERDVFGDGRGGGGRRRGGEEGGLGGVCYMESVPEGCLAVEGGFQVGDAGPGGEFTGHCWSGG